MLMLHGFKDKKAEQPYILEMFRVYIEELTHIGLFYKGPKDRLEIFVFQRASHPW